MKHENVDLTDKAKLQEVVELCSTMYNKSIHNVYELFIWKHLKNPFGKSICFAAYDGDRLVGVRIFMAWRFVYKGESVLAYRPVDTVTDTNYLRQGIFTTLTKLAVEEARKNEAVIIFNTPNEKSLPGYKKLGWTLGFKNTVYVKPYRPIKIFCMKFYRKITKAPNDKRGLSFKEKKTSFHFDKYTIPTISSTERSKEFITWRYIEHPLDDFLIVNEKEFTMVLKLNLRNNLKELVLCDLILRSENLDKIKKKAIQCLNLVGKKNNADYLVHKEMIILEKMKTLRTDFLSLYIKKPIESNFSIEYLSLGDLESF